MKCVQSIIIVTLTVKEVFSLFCLFFGDTCICKPELTFFFINVQYYRIIVNDLKRIHVRVYLTC